MERFLPLLLDVWRQVCREPRIDLSACAVTEIVRRRLPCDRLLIRHLDPALDRIETLAAVGTETAGAMGPAPALRELGP
jgi:hypothetical protein